MKILKSRLKKRKLTLSLNQKTSGSGSPRASQTKLKASPVSFLYANLVDNVASVKTGAATKGSSLGSRSG